MPRLFWKKAKKPIGEMTQSERREFAEDLARSALKNLTQEKIPDEVIEGLNALTQIELEELFNLYMKWSVIYNSERKKLVEPDYKGSIETLKRIRKLSREEFIRWRKEYYFLNWLDEVIASPKIQIYKEILSRRSSLMRQSDWNDGYENQYREISFKKHDSESPILMTLDLLIREKARQYEFVVNIEPDTIAKTKEDALNLFMGGLTHGIVLSSGDFRSLLKL
jgi:hypothetical protein